MPSVGPNSRSTFSRYVVLVGVSSFLVTGFGTGAAVETTTTTQNQTSGTTHRTANTSKTNQGVTTVTAEQRTSHNLLPLRRPGRARGHSLFVRPCLSFPEGPQSVCFFSYGRVDRLLAAPFCPSRPPAGNIIPDPRGPPWPRSLHTKGGARMSRVAVLLVAVLLLAGLALP